MTEIDILKSKIRELIKKTEIQKDTLILLMIHPETTEEDEIEKLRACGCFLEVFSEDLKKLLN